MSVISGTHDIVVVYSRRRFYFVGLIQEMRIDSLEKLKIYRVCK